MAAFDDIVSYYVNLLIIQYHSAPKARAMIDLFVRELLANNLAFAIRDAYNVSTAIGAQLDIVGLYVDVNRFYQGQDLTIFMALANYNEFPVNPTKIGVTDYTQGFTKVGRTITYNDYLSNNLALGDDDFRTLIYLRILQNNMNHSVGAINAAIYKIFGSSLYADSNGKMVMNYFYTGATVPPLILVAILKKLLPKPLGVRFNQFIAHTKPFFGYSTYAGGIPNGIVGFGTYAGGVSAGEELTYAKGTAGY